MKSRLYSVLISEEELRLFSEYLNEKYFARNEDSRISDEILTIARERQKSDSPEAINLAPYKKSSHHRMTTKYIKDTDPKIQTYMLREAKGKNNSNEFKFWEDYTKKIGENEASDKFRVEREKADLDVKRYRDFIDHEARKIDNLSESESELRDSGYDDKYASKFAEQVNRKRMDGPEAARIIERRKEKAEKYFEKDLKKEPGKLKNFRRKISDAIMVNKESNATEKAERRNKDK